MASKTKKVEKEKERLRLKIKSYDTKLIESSTKQIIEIARKHEAEVIGPIPLPTEIKKMTVNRSTFVHKNSREQFEVRVHKRLIDILNYTQRLIEDLSRISLPSGVSRFQKDKKSQSLGLRLGGTCAFFKYFIFLMDTHDNIKVAQLWIN